MRICRKPAEAIGQLLGLIDHCDASDCNRILELLTTWEHQHPNDSRVWSYRIPFAARCGRLDLVKADLEKLIESPTSPSNVNNTIWNIVRFGDDSSLAAARADGGVNRTEWGARAFANLKSVVRTCQKNGVRFFDYMLRLVGAVLDHETLPMPLKDNNPSTASAVGST